MRAKVGGRSVAGLWRILSVLGATAAAIWIWLGFDVLSALGCAQGPVACYNQQLSIAPAVIVAAPLATIALLKSAAPRISAGSMIWAFGLALITGAAVWMATEQGSTGSTLRPILVLAGGLCFAAGGADHIRRSSHKLKYFAFMFLAPAAALAALVVFSQTIVADQNLLAFNSLRQS